MQTFSPRISASECGELTNLRHRAEKIGFALINPEVLGTEPRRDDLSEFLQHLQNMPAEAYDDKITRRRFVTYAHFYKPNEFAESLLYFIVPEYDVDIGAKLFKYQLSKEVNRDAEGAVRKFAPVPDAALKHPFLQQLIEAGFYAVPLPSEYRSAPMEVEVQFIRYEPRRGIEAAGTPPTTHQDNDWAFCVFLLEWDNIDGALNAFVRPEHVNKPMTAVPAESILAEVVLTNPLEGYCVEDRKVAHYVGPVRLRSGHEHGRRTIVILSYKPLVPLRPADINAAADMLAKQPDLMRDRPVVAAQITVAAPGADTGTKPSGRLDRRSRAESEPIILKRGLYA